MPDINPTLALRELVYYDEQPFYVVGYKIVNTAMNNKVVYQIAQDLPNAYGRGRGNFPNELSIFDREELMSQSEYDAYELIQIELQANNYKYTLTGLPIIILNTTNDIFVFDGTLTYPWDGEAYPPYDPLTSIPLNTIWNDTGAVVSDLIDDGHHGSNGSLVSIGNINWDGNVYSIDNPEFTLYVEISYTDINNVTTLVPNINLSIIGKYSVSYRVVDTQGISSYTIMREVQVYDLPVKPPKNC